MLPTRQGSIRLFRFAGIEVFLHWSWFLILWYVWYLHVNTHASLVWLLLEYLCLFTIVLMHEFGHAFACRQVGGKADHILLWPLGGVAYAAPPPRPGATLWTIVAGPLVNVALAPIFLGLLAFGRNQGWPGEFPDLYLFVRTICQLNLVLLVFNLLPVYPLDGGQILQSLLWFVLGRARSMLVATIIGFVGLAGLVVFAANSHQPLFWVVCVFILLNCWGGLMRARLLFKIAKLPRRSGFQCPSCRQPPVLGPYWRCAKCLKPFDTFETQAVCPHCGTQFPVTQCLDCGRASPIAEWAQAPAQPPPLPPLIVPN